MALWLEQDEHWYLLVVIERSTKKELVTAVERKYKVHGYGPESRVVDAKGKYLKEVERRIQYEPKIKAALENIDWCIDGVEL